MLASSTVCLLHGTVILIQYHPCYRQEALSCFTWNHLAVKLWLAHFNAMVSGYNHLPGFAWKGCLLFSHAYKCKLRKYNRFRKHFIWLKYPTVDSLNGMLGIGLAHVLAHVLAQIPQKTKPKKNIKQWQPLWSDSEIKQCMSGAYLHVFIPHYISRRSNFLFATS